MQTLHVNGYDMAYLEVGQGHPLVCVHGTLGDFRVTTVTQCSVAETPLQCIRSSFGLKGF